MDRSAGIVIIYDNKILLGHSTGQNWQRSGYSFSKGGIDEGESIKDAAIRETEEEFGITIKPSQLKGKVHEIEYKKGGEIYKTVYYYVLNIKDLSEIGLSSTVIPKSQLQLKEVDWAGFMDHKEASNKIFKVMKDSLKHLNENVYFKLQNFKTRYE